MKCAGLGLALGVLLLGAAGCEDKELAAKSHEQQAKINELEDQLAVLRTSLANEPEGDPAKELAEAETALAEAKQRVEGLRDEVAKLSAERRSLEKEFEDYRRKYRIDQ